MLLQSFHSQGLRSEPLLIETVYFSLFTVYLNEFEDTLSIRIRVVYQLPGHHPLPGHSQKIKAQSLYLLLIKSNKFI